MARPAALERSRATGLALAARAEAQVPTADRERPASAPVREPSVALVRAPMPVAQPVEGSLADEGLAARSRLVTPFAYAVTRTAQQKISRAQCLSEPG